MGLKQFLKDKGFILDEHEDKIKNVVDSSVKTQQIPASNVPSFFPVTEFTSNLSTTNSDSSTTADPSFVAPLQQNVNEQKQEALDPSFVKFFEDELVKANLPGPDYFEFRQLLMKTQQKMASKGVVAPEVVLQTVIISFDAQDISPAKLMEAARHYKDALKQKNDNFLKGAQTEKNNQLQKRQAALQLHEENIKKIQQQIQQLELQKQQLDESLNKEKTQMDVDRTLGKEGIEKIERAERLISLAHNYIQSTIDTDIKRLQSM